MMLNARKFGRFALLVCIFALMILVLVACGDKNSSTPTEKPTDAPAAECKHENFEWTVTTPATCKATGTLTKSCVDCKSALATQTIQKVAHTEVIVPATPATCSSTGISESKKCSVCDEVTVAPTVTPKREHVEQIIPHVLPTLDTTGLTQGKKCTKCDTVLVAQTELPRLTAAPTGECAQHTETVLLALSPTCTDNGLTEGRICYVCGEITKAQTAVGKKAHTEEIALGKTPTCSEAGSTDGKKCSICTTVTVSQVILPPKGHSFTSHYCSGCGIAEKYGIWITDGHGNPMTDIFVKILKNGEQVKLLPYNGKYLSTDLPIGNYTIELDLTQISDTYTFDKDACILTPDKMTASIRLLKTTDSKESIFVGNPISKDYEAYNVTEGSYSLTLTPNDYTFLIFAPTKAAIYTVTYECSSELAISYHGSTFFVQGNDLSEGSEDIHAYENGISVSIYSSNIGGNYVFAVKSSGATSCVLNIKAAGDPGARLIDEPWIAYTEDPQKVAQHLQVSKDGTYTAIDLLDLSVSAVFNKNDGFYHLNSADGPIIFIDLTSDSAYISSLQTMCANQRLGVYIYDSNGNIVEKRSFNELFLQYGMPATSDEVVSEAIRVPLTEKLADAIKAYGEKASWWNDNSDANLFDIAFPGTPYNKDFAWLLFCGYFA